MPNSPASCGWSSVLTFANTTPSCFSEAFSYVGANWRQGPHQGAQKSTTTMSLPVTTDSKFSLVSSTVAMGRSPFGGRCNGAMRAATGRAAEAGT